MTGIAIGIGLIAGCFLLGMFIENGLNNIAKAINKR
jgi:hypothetical protein